MHSICRNCWNVATYKRKVHRKWEDWNRLFLDCCRIVLFLTGPHWSMYEVDLAVSVVPFISNWKVQDLIKYCLTSGASSIAAIFENRLDNIYKTIQKWEMSQPDQQLLTATERPTWWHCVLVNIDTRTKRVHD